MYFSFWYWRVFVFVVVVVVFGGVVKTALLFKGAKKF